MNIKDILNRKVLLASLIIASVLFCITLAYIVVLRPSVPAAGWQSGSADLTIIPAMTSTPTLQPPTLTPLQPTPPATSTLAPGQIGIGVYVRVSTDALHVRSAPGKDNTSIFLAYDAEVFQVTKGPQQADGYTWWYLTASYDTTRAGWAVQDYLAVIPSP